MTYTEPKLQMVSDMCWYQTHVGVQDTNTTPTNVAVSIYFHFLELLPVSLLGAELGSNSSLGNE